MNWQFMNPATIRQFDTDKKSSNMKKEFKIRKNPAERSFTVEQEIETTPSRLIRKFLPFVRPRVNIVKIRNPFTDDFIFSSYASALCEIERQEEIPHLDEN